jgi:transposase
MAQPLLIPEDKLFAAVPPSRLASLSKDEIIRLYESQQKVIENIMRDNERLREIQEELKQRILFVDDQYIELKNKLFGKSSEREPANTTEEAKNPARQSKTRVLLPSQRYPNATLIERHVTLQTLPTCDCCGAEMEDSGLTEDSEFLTVVPAQHWVVRQRRHKYGCGKCHGDMKTAPAPKRITPGGSYSDEMIIDASASKFCDLIPMERYTAIAARAGTPGLPPHSLIETTHQLADFVDGAYKRLKSEILEAKVLHADETPHRMLEGDDKTGWYLWGFSTSDSSYFECRDTRSGSVASDLLKSSKCEYLESDVYSGYGKTVRDVNEFREEQRLPLMHNVYCNAHARRYFKKAKDGFPIEAQFFINHYKEIYRLEEEAKGKPPDEILILRAKMLPHFEDMKARALAGVVTYSTKSKIAKAMNYFLGNYTELTLFAGMAELPIDNNPQERLLRSPVIGRKTWYGTHSKRGALTSVILFSLMQSCKLVGVNPRKYFKDLVHALHSGQVVFTPKEYKARLKTEDSQPPIAENLLSS